MAPRIIRVEAEHTLLPFLLEHLSDQKRGDIKRLLHHSAVSINGMAVTQHDKPLAPGDEISIDRGTSKASPAPGVDIVYEDSAIILINKPVGLLSVATPGEMTRTAHHVLNEYVQMRGGRHRGRVFVVHRLDRETSGLLLFARTTEIRQTLQDNWPNVEKRYYAVVEGLVKRESGTIKSRLAQDNSLQVRSVHQSDEGKDAVTHFRVLRHGKRRTLLDIELETGRKNQIRVHLSEINHSIVGDPRYGKKTGPGGRLALHAYRLSFDHPVTGERMEFETPLPTSFERMLTNG